MKDKGADVKRGKRKQRFEVPLKVDLGEEAYSNENTSKL